MWTLKWWICEPWCKLMQFCRSFSGSYAVILVGHPSVTLFLAAWKGSCTARDFFCPDCYNARQCIGCPWWRVVSVCLPWMLWLHEALTVAVVFCHLNSLLSILALRKKVGGGDQNCERPSDSLKNSIHSCSRGVFHLLWRTVLNEIHPCPCLTAQ